MKLDDEILRALRKLGEGTGYTITEEIRESRRSRRWFWQRWRPSAGALYIALDRLEKAGLVYGRTVPPMPGRQYRRRLYSCAGRIA